MNERTPPVRKVFQAELHQVGEELIQIATLVQQALGSARTAFLDADIQVAEEVISNDARIDFLQNDLDERSIDILALQSPVASDLRMIVGALRMSASLERMGDLARHLAQLARLRFPEPVLPEADRADFARMADLTAAAVRDASTVVAERDLELAAQVEKRDIEIDELMQSVYARIARDGGSYTAAQIADLTLLGRFYERLGDHAVSLVRRIGAREFDFSRRVAVMAIVNRTPDSFHDKGATFALDRAVDAALAAVADGADWVDVGGVPFGRGPVVELLLHGFVIEPRDTLDPRAIDLAGCRLPRR